MTITAWDVFWFFAGWIWLSYGVGICFGAWVRRGKQGGEWEWEEATMLCLKPVSGTYRIPCPGYTEAEESCPRKILLQARQSRPATHLDPPEPEGFEILDPCPDHPELDEEAAWEAMLGQEVFAYEMECDRRMEERRIGGR